MNAIRSTGDDVLAPTYSRPDDVFVRGEGCTLTTADGRSFLDMTSGIAVLALGHGSPLVADAIREAADLPVHISNLFHSPPPTELARALCERSFADRVFFCNSGAEAVEAAIKFARLGAGPERHRIVYFDGSFHGRTFGALAATDRPDYREPFRPLPVGFERAGFNDPRALDAVDQDTAAVIVEPIQGEAGIRVAGDAWLRALRERCDATGTLLIADEIQCGLGRTGALWACESAGVVPDLLTLAKPLGGGLPIGAVLMNERVSRALYPGCHGTTFGGNLLVTHVALRVLEAIDDECFLAGVRERGERLLGGLEAIDSALVREVRGRGLMVGVQVTTEPGRVVAAARHMGLLLVPAGDHVVRLLPPLNVSAADIGTAVELLEDALHSVEVES